MIDAAFIARVRAIVGDAGVLTDAADIAPYVHDWRGNYIGKTALVVRPANTEEVAAVVKLCTEARTPIVPQGGNTGMVGGGIPDSTNHAIVLSLTRMNKIRAIDLANNAMTVEAGCILAAVQEALDCFALGLKPQPARALLLRADPEIGDVLALGHRGAPPHRAANALL